MGRRRDRSPIALGDVMTETRDKNTIIMADPRISAGLLKRLCQRAGALDFSLEKYLSQIHDTDSILQVDRGIAAIFMAWAPLWVLMIALAFSPQGKDLLAQLSSDSTAALKFIAMLVVLCVVATFGATALIAAWLYPRLGFERPYLYWPTIPDSARRLNDVEIDDVLRSARAPIVVAIGIPIALLATASFTPLAWALEPVILFAIAVLLFAILIWKVARLATRYVLHLTAWSFIAMLFGLACLETVGFSPALVNSCLTIEVLSVSIAIAWLLVFFGFAFAIYASRHDTLSSRSPSFLGQHFRLVFIAIILLLIHFARAWWWPEEPTWMMAAPAAQSSGQETSEPDTARMASSAAMDAFKALHAQEQRPPLVLVTAAGGGIRAAYWSARVLSTLQDRQSNFASHIFAISAVSGGALGTSAFKALTTMDTRSCPDVQTYTVCASRFLGGDFIGPNIAAVSTGGVFSLLTSGLANPLVIPRDLALEDGWSVQWNRIVPTGPQFYEPFDDLFKKAQLPALLLNGTSTKSGNRVITSNLDVSTLKPSKPQQSEKTQVSAKTGGSDQSQPEGCIVDRGIVNPAQYLRLPVSSAVLTSARFPYITPPGLLRLPPSTPKPGEARTSCRDWEEIVDGGFIDNEGIVTMREVLEKLVELNGGATKFKSAFRLIVIRLSAEASPVIASHEKNTPPKRDNLDQVYSTAMNQLAAAGQSLVRDFREQIEGMGGTWVEFNAIDEDAPLGWTLSSLSRQRLDAWLDGPSSPQWAEINRELPGEDAKILRTFAGNVDLPGRFQAVLSQFETSH